MTSLEYYIEQVEQFIFALTEDIESGEGTIVTQTKLAVYREVLEHLEEIQQEPSYNSIKPELKPCDDAISRTEVIKSIDEREDVNGKVDAESVRTDIVLMQPVNPQPKTGHWRHYEGMLTCSECGSEFYDDIMEYCGDDVPKFCPKCGAKMQEVEE